MSTYPKFVNGQKQALLDWAPKPLTGAELHANLMEFATAEKKPGFYTLRKDLPAFKTAKKSHFGRSGPLESLAIVNLIIPAGAEMYWKGSSSCTNAGNHKMRASRAFVHSIHAMDTGEAMQVAFSDHEFLFAYKPGRTTVPHRFDRESITCAGGIHFFMNLYHALDYLTWA